MALFCGIIAAAVYYQRSQRAFYKAAINPGIIPDSTRGLAAEEEYAQPVTLNPDYGNPQRIYTALDETYNGFGPELTGVANHLYEYADTTT